MARGDRRQFRNTKSPRTRGGPPAARLGVEDLEDRVVPAAGALDSTFGNFGRVTTDLHANTDVANAVAIDSQGRIVVAGSSLFGGDTDFAVARYLSNGKLDTTFNGSGFRTIDVAGNGHNDAATGVAIDSQGRIVLGGWAFNGTNDDFAAVRLNANGTLDSSFNGTGQVKTTISGEARANAVAIDGLDRPILAGFAHIGGDDDFALVRYTSLGALDATFDSDGRKTYDVAGNGHDDHANGVALDSQGRIVAGGFAFNGTDNDFAVARFKADGTIDTSFNSGSGQVKTNIAADDVGRGVAIDTLDRIVLAGYSFLGGDYDFEVARYTSAGVLDASFGFGGTVRDNITTGQNDFGTSVAIDAAGNILVGGYSFVPNDDDFAVARFRSNGTLDTTFGTNGNTTINFTGNDFANGVAVDSIGRAVLVGQNGAANIDFALTRVTGNQVAVSVTVTDGVSKATVGQTVTYTITVANAGPDAATRVQLADTFPAGLTGVTYTSAATGGATGNTAAGNGNIADALTLPSGASVTYTATGAVTGPAGGSLVNIATATVFGALDANSADNAATDADAVGTPPAFTSAAAATLTAGGPGAFTVTSTGVPAPALTANGLPAGVTFTDNGNGTGTLAATAAAPAGVFTLTITAANGFATDATQHLTLTIGRAPAFTSPAAATFTAGTPGTFTVTSTGNPTATVTLAGALPTGVTFTGNPDGTATLSGIPTAVGTFPLTFAAGNGFGPGAVQNFALTVRPAPVPFLVGGPADGSVRPLAAAGGTFQLDSPVAALAGLGVSARTAVADVTGDGVADFIVGAGPGSVPRVTILDGTDKATLATFDAFEPTFTGGVYVAAADLDGDGKAEVVVTPDRGGGPIVAVYSGAKLAAGLTGDAAQVARFFGIDDPNFRGGARPSLGDVNGDGTPDLVISAGFLGGPRIAVFDGRSLGGTPVKLVPDFFAFEPTLRNGAFVAAGDVDGDGAADVAFGGGPGGAPRVRVFSGRALLAAGGFASLDDVPAAQLANFFAGDVGLRGGVRVALKDADGDGRAELVTGSGEGEPSRVRVFKSTTVLAGSSTPDQELDPFGATLAGGVFVG
jgi:uncharacterized delta-60 repeat protein/uncharacterized repeat protein (TIGR01451 family)